MFAPPRSPHAGGNSLETSDGSALAGFAGGVCPLDQRLHRLRHMEQARSLADRLGETPSGRGSGIGNDRRNHGVGPPGFRRSKGRLRNQALGRSRGGISTKIHLICDSHGNPLDFLGTPGQAHESGSAETLLWGWKAAFVLGDRAYDGNPLRKVIEAVGAEAVIPLHPCRNEPAVYDAFLYKARHAIENAFPRLMRFRRLATRFDKTARSYSAQVAIACIVVW